MSSEGVLQRLSTLGGAEVGWGPGAEGGGAPCAEPEPQAGLMGPRGPNPLRAEPPSPSGSSAVRSGARLAYGTHRVQREGEASQRMRPLFSGLHGRPGSWDLGLGAVDGTVSYRSCDLGGFLVASLSTWRGRSVCRSQSRPADCGPRGG